LFGKLYCDSIGENESKDDIEQMIVEIAMTNCKRLNEANKLSFKGLLSVLESEYCAKYQIVKNAVANRKWQQIFESERHFFHFVRNFLSDLKLDSDWTEESLGSLLISLTTKLISCKNGSQLVVAVEDVSLFNKGFGQFSATDGERFVSTLMLRYFAQYFHSASATKKHRLYTPRDFIALDVTPLLMEEGRTVDEDTSVNDHQLSREEIGVLRAVARYKAYPHALYCEGRMIEMWTPFVTLEGK
jgi:hypothetical protein